jgi:damage-control phosphatase, subfamily I
MNTLLDCIPCFARQALEAVVLATNDPLQRESLLRELLYDIAETNWQGTPPAMGQRIHRRIRDELHCPDPYRDIKTRMNRMAARLVPQMRERIAAHPDPREAAVRVAIGGNLLDVGAKTRIDAADLPAHLDTIWTQPLHGDLEGLFRAAERAHSILYLADNAGEIFFDRLLIEQLPAEKITVFVRGFPVLNDATVADAEQAGLPQIVPVLGNGSDAPGTILEDCSEAFRGWFDRADLIIAKGQGNYETLSDSPRPVYFLFTVKCPLVAEQIGEPVGSLVVKPGRSLQEYPE